MSSNRHYLYSTILAGVLGLSTLGLFYNGAEALDLGDFTGADQKVITQDAPKAGGIVLVKEDIVYPTQQRAVRGNGPILTATSSSNTATGMNAVAPASGGQMDIRAEDDITLRPGNAYDRVKARLNSAGAAQVPVDGKPLTTTTTAEGARVQSLNDITPAAGGMVGATVEGPAASAAVPPLPTINNNASASVQSKQSVQAMTGADSNNAKDGSYNN